MNTNQHISNQVELEQLINRYFDGETTAKEERKLRSILADCPWSSETIDEARFTMGYYVAHTRQRRHAAMFTQRYRIAAITASVAIMLAIGGHLLWQNRQPQGTCMAYVNGKVISNKDVVMELITQDLNTMDEASQSMEAQLLSIGEALELDNN